MAVALVGIQVKVGGVKQSVAEINSLKTAVDQLGRSVRDIGKIKTPKLANNLNIVGANSTAIIDQRDFSKRVDQSSKSIIRFGAVSENARKRILGLTRAMKGLGAATKRVFTGFAGVASRITQTGRSLVSFGSILSTLGFRLGVLFTPFVLGIGAAVSKAVEFEDSIVGLLTRVRIGLTDMEAMRDGVLSLSSSLGIQPTELAAAAYGVMSREIRSTDDALKILELASKASAIGLGEVSGIANLVSAAFITMGDEAGGITGIMDTLVRAVQFGAIEADDFTDSLGRALGLAVNLGINLDEMTAFIGVFGIATDDASEAVTGLVGVMRAVIAPSKKAKEAFARIFDTGDDLEAGAKAAKAALDELGLFSFLHGVSKAADELDIPLANIFTRLRGLNAALFVSEAAFEQYQSVLSATKDSAGALEEAFKIVQVTTGFQLKLLKSNIEVAAIAIGDALLPAVNSIVQAIVPMIIAIKDFVKLRPQVALVAAAFALVAAAVGPLVIIFGIFLSSIGTIISAGGALLGLLISLLNPLNLIGVALLVLVGLFVLAFGATIPGKIKQGLQESEDSLEGFGGELAKNMTSTADHAFAWGANIVIQLAEGIASAAIYVINVIKDIGNAIAKLLKGASPPPLLPELNAWGANIVDELLRGFTMADFSVLDDLSGLLSRFFRSLPGLDDVGAISSLLGSREAIAEAIAMFRETGTVSQDVLDSISGSFGSLSVDIQEYVRLMLAAAAATEAVSEAQEAVDEITKAFDETVRPLNKRLGEIADRFDEVNRAQEREALQDILDDPRAPELAKELALLQLERLSIEEQVDAAEDLRDTELEIANARLRAAQELQEAAQDQLNLQKALIDAQIEQLELQKSLEETTKKLADAAGSLAEELSSLAAGGFDPGDLGEGLLEQIGAAFTEKAELIKADLELLWADVLLTFEPVLEALANMKKAWQEVFAVMDENDITLGDVVKFLLGIWFALQLIKFVGPATILKGLWGALKLVALWGVKAAIAITGSAAATGIKAGFVGGLSKIGLLLSGPAGVLALLAIFLGIAIAEKYDTNADAVDGFGQAISGLKGILDVANKDFAGFILELSLEISGLDNAQKALVRETVFDWDLWEKAVVGALTEAHTTLDALALGLGTWLTDSAIDIETWSRDAIEDVGLFFTDWDDKVIDFLEGSGVNITDFFNGLAEIISGVVTSAIEAVTGKWDSLTASVLAFINMMKNVFIPPDLTESESHFSRTLRHTTEGFDAATASALQFMRASNNLTAPMPLNAQAAMAGGSGGQINVGPNHISNGMDEAIFAARVKQVVAGAIT